MGGPSVATLSTWTRCCGLSQSVAGPRTSPGPDVRSALESPNASRAVNGVRNETVAGRASVTIHRMPRCHRRPLELRFAVGPPLRPRQSRPCRARCTGASSIRGCRSRSLRRRRDSGRGRGRRRYGRPRWGESNLDDPRSLTRDGVEAEVVVTSRTTTVHVLMWRESRPTVQRQVGLALEGGTDDVAWRRAACVDWVDRGGVRRQRNL